MMLIDSGLSTFLCSASRIC